MPAAFWLRRFFIAFVIAALVIGGSQWLRGRPLDYSIAHACIWGFLSSVLFTFLAFRRWRKAQDCIACNQLPHRH